MAQEKYGFEIGAYAGPTYWQERHVQVNAPQNTVPVDFNFNYNDKAAYGVRFNLLSRGYWGGELDYNYQKNTVTLSRPSFVPVSLKGSIQHFYYNTIFYPIRYSEKHISPFLTAGVGLAAYRVSDEARAVYPNLQDLDERFAFNYGGGVKAIVAPHLGLRVDFRHNFSDVPTYGLPQRSPSPFQPVQPVRGKLQNYEVSGGVYFQALK